MATLNELVAAVPGLQDVASETVKQLQFYSDEAARTAEHTAAADAYEKRNWPLRQGEREKFVAELTGKTRDQQRLAAETLLRQQQHLEDHAATIERMTETIPPAWTDMPLTTPEHERVSKRADDEEVTRTIRSDMASWTPVETHRRYRAALASEDRPTQRVIEAYGCRESRTGPPSLDDVNAMFLLERAIRAARKERHHPAATQLRAFLAGLPSTKQGMAREKLKLIASDKFERFA